MSHAPEQTSDAPRVPEEMGEGTEPAGPISRKKVIWGTIFTLVSLVGLYLLIPKLAGFKRTWGQLKHGDPVLLALAMAFELVSIGGYALLFHTVFSRGNDRIDWRVSLEIPLAGIAAIRLLAAAGAGGVALTVWALLRARMDAGVIACRMVASYVIQYSLYLGALVVCGLGLRWGLFSGEAPFALTVLPAALSAIGIVLIAAMGLVPRDFERRLRQLSQRSGRVGRIAARFASAPAALGSGVRTAEGLIKERRLGLLGALIYWGFDIAVLYLSFAAFGHPVPGAVVVMGYFLGTLGSLLPLAGGVGGVEGGMFGAFVAFGVPVSSALIGTLAYRAISFWIPTLPGIFGYVSLRKTVRRWQAEDAQSEADAPSAAR
jgi:uncharacterized protein (TIRG00374 family)